MAHRVTLRLHDHKVPGSNPAWDFLSGSVRTAVSRLRGKANPCAWFQVQDPSEHMSQPLHNRTVVMHPFVPVFRHLYWHFCSIHTGEPDNEQFQPGIPKLECMQASIETAPRPDSVWATVTQRDNTVTETGESQSGGHVGMGVYCRSQPGPSTNIYAYKHISQDWRV